MDLFRNYTVIKIIESLCSLQAAKSSQCSQSRYPSSIRARAFVNSSYFYSFTIISTSSQVKQLFCCCNIVAINIRTMNYVTMFMLSFLLLSSELNIIFVNVCILNFKFLWQLNFFVLHRCKDIRSIHFGLFCKNLFSSNLALEIYGTCIKLDIKTKKCMLHAG